MTANQIKKAIAKSGILYADESVTISRDEIEIHVDYIEKEHCGRKYGECNEAKTKALANKIAKLFPGVYVGGTGYGAHVIMLGGYSPCLLRKQNID